MLHTKKIIILFFAFAFIVVSIIFIKIILAQSSKNYYQWDDLVKNPKEASGVIAQLGDMYNTVYYLNDKYHEKKINESNDYFPDFQMLYKAHDTAFNEFYESLKELGVFDVYIKVAHAPYRHCDYSGKEVDEGILFSNILFVMMVTFKQSAYHAYYLAYNGYFQEMVDFIKGYMIAGNVLGFAQNFAYASLVLSEIIKMDLPMEIRLDLLAFLKESMYWDFWSLETLFPGQSEVLKNGFQEIISSLEDTIDEETTPSQGKTVT